MDDLRLIIMARVPLASLLRLAINEEGASSLVGEELLEDDTERCFSSRTRVGDVFLDD